MDENSSMKWKIGDKFTVPHSKESLWGQTWQGALCQVISIDHYGIKFKILSVSTYSPLSISGEHNLSIAFYNTVKKLSNSKPHLPKFLGV